MGKKLLTEESLLEKFVMLLLKGRFYKIANEVKKDPRLFIATKKFNESIEELKAALAKYKEEFGVDIGSKENK